MKRPLKPALLSLLALSCSGDPAAPPVRDPEPDLFYEPPSVYLVGTSDADSVVVYNFGAGDLVWTPVHVPPGSDGLEGERTLPPNTAFVFDAIWSPDGALPASDSLVATTNDPLRPRVVVPVHVVAPGALDITPPDPPFLLFPEDGAMFRFEDVKESGILLEWSRVDDASGIGGYVVEVDSTRRFDNPLQATVTATALIAEPESTDVGRTAYWRVRAVEDRENRVGGRRSRVRSWTLVP